MTDIIAPHGPFTIEISVAFSNEAGDVAKAKIDLPPGTVPTIDDMAIVLRNAVAQLAENDMGLVPMGRHEFVEHLFEEKTGMGGFAIPGPDEFEIKLDGTTVGTRQQREFDPEEGDDE